jgi:RNA polymerase sigma-70 factor (ECF subfamily)
VTERFVAAALGGDLDALQQMLAPEVTLWGDGGGRVGGGVRPLQGRDKVARLLTALASRSGEGITIAYRSVNGDPSAVPFVGDSPYAVIVLDLTADGGQVRGIYSVANPDKLTHVD